MSRANCSDRALISSKALRSTSARCRGGVAAQPGSAACAALTASSPSLTVPFATSASGSSVAGLKTGNVPRPLAPLPSDQQPRRDVDTGELGDTHVSLLALNTVLVAR